MTRLKYIVIGFVFMLGLLPGNSFAQELVQHQKFTYAPLFNNQVVLVREIPLFQRDSERSFVRVKEWGKERYALSPLVSNIRYDNSNKEIIVKSKIELLLPENNAGIRESVIMTYHLNTFIFNDKCIFEVNNITYKLQDVKKSVKAEDIITSAALAQTGSLQELRINIQKSTLFFFNELADSLEETLNITGDR